MTLPNLISFSGYADAGKDVAADILVQRARFIKAYMAKPLEEVLVELNPWIEDHKEGGIERFADLYGNLGERAIKDFIESQRFLKALEVEVARKFGENIWIDLVFNEVKALLSLDKKVALSGVRHLDELARVRELDGVCVWIERQVIRNQSGTAVTAGDCDVVVINNGTPKELYVKLVVALEEFNLIKDDSP